MNPFRLLELPTDATAEQIVTAAEERCGSVDEASQPLYRDALHHLTTHAFARLKHELFEVPGARYTGAQWEAFLKGFRKNPVDPAALSRGVAVPTPSEFDWRALIHLALEERLSVPIIEIKPAVEQPPFAPGLGAAPLEIRDVIFG